MPAAPEKPIVCYVTDRKLLGTAESTGSVLARIRAAVEAGVDWVQIREKDLQTRELLALAREAAAAARGRARVIVNDRLDVAIAANAAGVHLGRESAPAVEVVRWSRGGNAPAEFPIGVSCHTIDEARDAERAGASYVFFGPIFDTPSKRLYGAPQGIAAMGEVCRGVRLPVVAIGGVNDENARDCIRAGAAGIAAIRLFQEPRDPAALKEVVARIHSYRQERPTR